MNYPTIARRRVCENDSNGVIQAPSGPGFGVDIDPGFVKQAKVVTG
jgi:hypothetical protein